MKKLIILPLLAFMLGSCVPENRRHIGTWQAFGGNLPGTVRFTDKTVEMTTPDGAETAPYIIDYTKTPIWIDIKMTDGMARGIMEFLTNDVIMAAGGEPNEPRPGDFKSAEYVTILKRAKDKPGTKPPDKTEPIQRIIVPKVAQKPRSTIDKHIGTWELTGEGLSGTAIFGDTKIVMTTSDDAESEEYVVDYTKTPIWIDITTNRGLVRGIMEFPDKDTLRIANNHPGEPRPTAFKSAKEDVTFKRSKNEE